MFSKANLKIFAWTTTKKDKKNGKEKKKRPYKI